MACLVVMVLYVVKKVSKKIAKRAQQTCPDEIDTLAQDLEKIVDGTLGDLLVVAQVDNPKVSHPFGDFFQVDTPKVSHPFGNCTMHP